MTPPDLDEAVRLARETLASQERHGAQFPSEERAGALARAVLALDERCRVLEARERRRVAVVDEILGEDTTSDEDVMPKVDGRRFSCPDCRATVFRKLVRDPNVYVCNGCGSRYRGEPIATARRGGGA